MEPKNILDVTIREEFRQWLEENHNKKSECWAVAKKGKHKPENKLWYLDAVEEVLCFGWIVQLINELMGLICSDSRLRQNGVSGQN